MKPVVSDSAERSNSQNKFLYWAFIFTIVMGLYLTTRVNYLLFHSLVELFSIIVASTVFIITWNALKYIKNSYLIMVGISYLFIGLLDLLHTLAYKGMPVFTDYDYYANQLWIAARALESITLLAAFLLLFTSRNIKAGWIFILYTLTTALLVASIFYWKIFPVCFIDGKGLTPFKINSEYVICAILVASIVLLIRNKNHFTGSVYKLLLLSMTYTIVSELSFTFYIDNYGISNLVGHFFKLFSFLMIYHAIIATGIEEPFHLIFKELNLTNESLRDEIDLRKKTEHEREAVINSLKNALDEIKVLKGILPICMHCKKIRDDSGYWSKLETYIHNHSEADFSHGICPDCMDRHYPAK
ncbi:MAG: MASE3 domain-containing protein [Pedobacter sp.]